MLALVASEDTQSDDMPTKITKNNSDIFSKFFQAKLYRTIETSTFPEQLNYADVKPVFNLKKIQELTRKTIGQSSILSNISKIYERCFKKQLEECLQALLCKYEVRLSERL